MSSLTWLSKAATLLIVLSISPTEAASSNDNKITALPGQPSVEFSQYAGYITVDDADQRSLFYYFVEAQSHPETKPLVLWLNGGPGCSSVSAAFYGHGPFIPKGDSLTTNNFSWNQEANILFLDTPAGTGFSYSRNKSFYAYTNDEITVQDNLRFLFGWLKQFPEYNNRDLFISGVSYAGHFVTQLADLVLYTSLKPNLRGILIGNALLDFDTDHNAQGDFLWSHGLISDSSYSMLNMICNVSQLYRQSMDGNLSPACLQVSNQVSKEVGSLVVFDHVLSDACLSESSSQVKEGVDVCLLFQVIKYFNRKDVQQAFHAKLVGVSQWSLCTNDSDIGYDPKDQLVSMIPILGHLAKEGIRIMIFSGDEDATIPFIGTRRLMMELAEQLGLQTTLPYMSWLNDKQVGGWTQIYGEKLSFATVRGGGHDSAFWQPERTLILFNTYLQGNPLDVGI